MVSHDWTIVSINPDVEKTKIKPEEYCYNISAFEKKLLLCLFIFSIDLTKEKIF